MFDRASKIRIPTTLTFYLLTFLLSLILLAVLQVSTRNFYFGVATTLLAHAAVYLLTRERIPTWATLFILALVVPQFPPEALTPVEQGALYWGILAGLVSYAITYGSHYLLNLNREAPDQETKDGRRKRVDRHTSELFQLLNVTNLSQAVRATRKLLQERERLVDAAETNEPGEVDLVQQKLKEAQQQVKELRKRLDQVTQPLEAEHRQMKDRLQETQRQMQQTIVAREQAEERAQSLESFQLKVADLTQQLNTLRGQSHEHQQLIGDLRHLLAETESARDAARRENERLSAELVQRRAESEQTSSSQAESRAAKGELKTELTNLKQQLQDLSAQNQQSLERLQTTEQALATAHCRQQELQAELDQLQARPDTKPDRFDKLQQRVTALEMERDRAVAELGCMRSRLREKTREIDRRQTDAGRLDQTLKHQQTQLAEAQKKIESLEDSLAFYRRTVDELTPEVDRLDSIISEYENSYGPLPSKQNTS
jgi:chromosome segregation ATPase